MRGPGVRYVSRAEDKRESSTSVGAIRPQDQGALLSSLMNQREVVVCIVGPRNDTYAEGCELGFQPWLVLKTRLLFMKNAEIVHEISAGKAGRGQYGARPIRYDRRRTAKRTKETLANFMDLLRGILIYRVAIEVNSHFCHIFETCLLDPDSLERCDLAEDLFEVADFKKRSGIGSTGAEVDKATASEAAFDLSHSLPVSHHSCSPEP